jgi:hypothetical protein
LLVLGRLHHLCAPVHHDVGKYIGPSRGAFGGDGARAAQDDKGFGADHDSAITS